MKLCISCGPAGVFEVKVSVSRLSFANCFFRKASALSWPGQPTQRGPMDTNWRVYSRARWPLKVSDAGAADATVAKGKLNSKANLKPRISLRPLLFSFGGELGAP